MLDESIRAAGGIIVAEASPRLSEIGSYRLPGIPAAAQLIELDLAGISVSAGSACSSGSLKPSPVLMAMGWSEVEAREVIRISMAPETSEADIARFLAAWTKLKARRAAA
jgi:cysteine desulfurase